MDRPGAAPVDLDLGTQGVGVTDVRRLGGAVHDCVGVADRRESARRGDAPPRVSTRALVPGRRDAEDAVLEASRKGRHGVVLVQRGLIRQQIGVEDELPQRALPAVVGVDDRVEVEAEVHAGDVATARVHRDDRLRELAGRGLQRGQRVAAGIGGRVDVGRLLPADPVRTRAGGFTVAVRPEGLDGKLRPVGARPGRGDGGVDDADGVQGRAQSGEAVASVGRGRGRGEEIPRVVVELDRHVVAFDAERAGIGAGRGVVAAHSAAVVDVLENRTADGHAGRDGHGGAELGGVVRRIRGCGGYHIAHRHGDRNNGIERCVAAAVGAGRIRAQKDLALAGAGRIRRRTGEELERERGVRSAVQRSENGRVSARRGGGGQHGVVLQQVGAAVPVAGIVGRDPEAVFRPAQQVDSEHRVVVDLVSGHPVPARRALHANAAHAVPDDLVVDRGAAAQVAHPDTASVASRLTLHGGAVALQEVPLIGVTRSAGVDPVADVADERVVHDGGIRGVRIGHDPVGRRVRSAVRARHVVGNGHVGRGQQPHPVRVVSEKRRIAYDRTIRAGIEADAGRAVRAPIDVRDADAVDDRVGGLDPEARVVEPGQLVVDDDLRSGGRRTHGAARGLGDGPVGVSGKRGLGASVDRGVGIADDRHQRRRIDDERVTGAAVDGRPVPRIGRRDHEDRVVVARRERNQRVVLVQRSLIRQQVGVEDELPEGTLAGVVGVDDRVEVEPEIDRVDVPTARVDRDDRLRELAGRGLQRGQRVAARVGGGVDVGRLLAADPAGAGAGRLSVAVDPVGLNTQLRAVRSGPGRGDGVVDHAHRVNRRREAAHAVGPVRGRGRAGNEVAARVVELDGDTAALHGEARRVGRRGGPSSAGAAAIVDVLEDRAAQPGGGSGHRRDRPAELRSASEKRTDRAVGADRRRCRKNVSRTSGEGVAEVLWTGPRVGDVHRIDERLAFPETGSVRDRVGEEVDAVVAGGQIDTEADRDAAAPGGGCAQDRVVQKIVGTRVRVSDVVRCHAVVVQVDSQARVRVDRVEQDRVVNARARVRGHTVPAVEGDEICCARGRATDARGEGRRSQQDAVGSVGDGPRPGGIRADVVTVDEGGRSADSNPVLSVPGDEVTGGGYRAADRVDVGAAADEDSVDHVPEGDGSREVRADDVALDGIHVGAVDEDPFPAVAGHEVARTGRGAADRVPGRPGAQRDAIVAVPEDDGAGYVRADEIALDHVAARCAALNVDPLVVVARHEVAGGGGRAADRVVVARHPDAVEVSKIGRARHVRAEVIPLDEVPAAGRQLDADAAACEPVDHEATHRAAAGGDPQPVLGGGGEISVQLDDRAAAEARLRGAVEDDRIRDRRQ